MERLRPGLARREFFAVKPEVDEFLASGGTYRLAYDMLIEKGKISMSYDTFRQYAGGMRPCVMRRRARKGDVASPPQAQTPALPAQRGEKASKAVAATPPDQCPEQKRKCIIAGGSDGKPAFGRHPKPDWLESTGDGSGESCQKS